jgi:hypothetical protein
MHENVANNKNIHVNENIYSTEEGSPDNLAYIIII